MADNHILFVSVDVGSSGTKVIYQFKGWSKPQFLMMSPHLEQINKSDFLRYQQGQLWNGIPLPEHEAFLEWQNQIFVVGDFALVFADIDRIKERKYENALYKVLAAIGVILEKHEVSPTKNGKGGKANVVVHLAFLLPWNEYNDYSRFHAQLQKMLAEFKFRGQAWNVQLSEHFLCRPEGAGLLAIYTKRNGVSGLQHRKVAVLMLGHRNTTLLYFEQGVRKFADSPQLGFSLFLDMVCSRVSGIGRDQLAAAIFVGLYEARMEVYGQQYQKYGLPSCTVHPQWINLKAIQGLAAAKDASLRAREIQDIAAAISVATSNYWFRLQQWLQLNLPEWVNDVIVGGGAAAFLEPELETFFNCAPDAGTGNTLVKGKRAPGYKHKDTSKRLSNLVWMDNITRQIQSTFFIGYGDGEQELPFRLVDCFGMMDQLLDRVKEVKGDRSQKKA